MPEALTIREAAEHWRVSTKTVRRMIDRGELPVFRVGPRLIRIPAATVRRVESAAQRRKV